MLEQILDMLVVPQADDTHVKEVGVDVAGVEEILSVCAEYVVACFACVQVGVVAKKRMLEVVDSIALKGVVVKATFGTFVYWKVDIFVISKLVDL